MSAVADFIGAALPWVLMGIAVAIICAVIGTKNAEPQVLEKNMSVGIALGLMFGVALNSAGVFGGFGTAIALGPLWGIAISAVCSTVQKKHE